VIGRIRRLPLREVWKHEALDFTRWLELNIDVLNEVIGFELSAAEREHAAGDFSVDIIAEDASGRPVVIENQLERSDHDHLGKLITYLSVLEASAAIWIVADARPEHVAAISWLNESRGTAFYLVKAEAIAIGDSQPAPLLTLLVGPSEETREVGDTKRELAERHHIRRRFWSQLLDTARERTRLHAAISPSTESWVSAGAGISGLGFNYVTTQHSARVELYIDRGDEEENARVFQHFLDRREQIEAEFGAPLDWQPLPGRRACRINCEAAQQGYRDEDAWDAVHASMVDAMVRLEAALKPAIAELR
jgi:hypothetical protein